VKPLKSFLAKGMKLGVISKEPPQDSFERELMVRFRIYSSIRFYLVACCAFTSWPDKLSAAVLNSPSQTAVNAAISAPMISFRRDFSGGAYTNGAFYGGASITLAVASYAGNTTADARLLQQIRHSLVGTNAICANGGYPAQHERHVTGMVVIVKHTPRIWNQLTAGEKSKIDLLMKAALVASAFTTSDNNPFVLGAGGERTLDGDFNIGRGWNPNYREGMLGGVLVGMVYFGGSVPTDTLLKNYSHTAFVAELASSGLTNTHQIFNWKVANPTSSAPSGTQVESAVRNFRHYGNAIANYMAIYDNLSRDTYGKRVNSGLNGGAGIDGAGKIVSGADTLPNPGAAGMLKEFDSSDANGPRSSALYCYDGFRPHQTNQLVLIIGGYWQRGSAITNAAAARMKVGNTDLGYKLDKGYLDYQKGKARGVIGADFKASHGYAYVWPLWTEVLLPYHESVDTDGDGTNDLNEIRLGLDPANGASNFSIKQQGMALQWPGKANLMFRIQRMNTRGPTAWETIATIPGVEGIHDFTDPTPPPEGALYRVGLDP
jgi:hypothetical protein